MACPAIWHRKPLGFGRWPWGINAPVGHGRINVGGLRAAVGRRKQMNIVLAMVGALSEGVLWAVMTLGVFISYKVLHFADLSVDGTFALGGVVSAVLITKGVNPVLALLVSMLAGMAGGVTTALLHTKLKIPGLLSGILTMLALYSITLRVTGGAGNVAVMRTMDTLVIMLQRLLPLSRDVANILLGTVFCALLICLMYWFFGTEIGCALRATGDNERMARALGTNTDNMIILGLLLSNGLVGMAGGLIAQSRRAADVTMGTGTMVIGLASIIIGEVVFRFIRRNFALKLLAVVLGSIVYRIIVAVVLQLGLNTNDMKLLSALMVVIAMSLPLIRGKMRARALGRGGVVSVPKAFEDVPPPETPPDDVPPGPKQL